MRLRKNCRGGAKGPCKCATRGGSFGKLQEGEEALKIEMMSLTKIASMSRTQPLCRPLRRRSVPSGSCPVETRVCVMPFYIEMRSEGCIFAVFQVGALTDSSRILEVDGREGRGQERGAAGASLGSFLGISA